MEWRFNEDKSSWDLYDSTSVIARIFIREKADTKKPFRTKTIISSIYYGGHTFSRLTRKNKEWKVYNRKFAARQEMDTYLEAKKQAIKSFLNRL
jgi:hypothetical protein